MKVWKLLLGLLSVSICFAQRDFSKVEIKVEKVSDGLYMLIGAGGNIGVSVGDDGVFIIDDQYAPLTDKIRAAIAGISDKPIRFVLNTHWHGDHTGGNENLGSGGSIIVAHENVRSRMNSEQFNELFGRKTPPSPAVALPVVTFSDAVTFHLNGEDIHGFHVNNAHTDGDTIIHFRKANVVHTGDVLFFGTYPFIDVDSGGSIDGVIAAADKMLAMVDDQTKIIPGHGALCDKAALKVYRDMLVGVRGVISGEIAAGKTLEQLQASKPLAAWDEAWGKGFINPENFLKILYRDLSRKK